MGRSVSTPRNAVAVCYQDISSIGLIYDEDTEELTDEYDDLQLQLDFDVYKDDLIEQIKNKWSSFDNCAKWLSNEDHAFMENQFAYIGISTYCGLAAIWLVSKADDIACSCYGEDQSLANLADGFCNRIAPNFHKLFDQYRKIATASNGEAFFEKVS